MLRSVLNSGAGIRVAGIAGRFARISASVPSSTLSLKCGVVNIPTRQFSITSTTLASKKKGGKGKNSKDNKNAKITEEEDVEPFDSKGFLKEAEKSFKEIAVQCDKEMKTIKLAGANPELFNNIVVPLGSTTAKFPEVAQVVIKGNHLINVTVFDPNNTKRVRAAIFEAGLDLNPELDPNNPQALKIVLAAPTSQRKEAFKKNFKKCMDEFLTVGRVHSVAAVRRKYLDELSKAKKRVGGKDDLKKLTDEVEKLSKKASSEVSAIHKKFSDAL